MRALLVLFTIAVIAGIAAYVAWRWREASEAAQVKASPEAIRGATIAHLTEKAAQAAAEGRHAEAARLDYALHQLLLTFNPEAQPFEGTPHDDWPGFVIKGGRDTGAPRPTASARRPDPPVERNPEEDLAAAIERLKATVIDVLGPRRTEPEPEEDLGPVEPRIPPRRRRLDTGHPGAPPGTSSAGPAQGRAPG